jgi:NADPH-dependent 2,4-dienoyl-CoA reductase/sulfur reductase-like enzyme
MPKLIIDQREVEVPEGATVFDAASRLGIDIPALCCHNGCNRSTSCLACLVRIGGQERLVPSCATAAVEGMQVESETETVRQARRTSLELLLSDHLGDCMAPCQLGCPAQMDIPLMLRQIAAGQLREAIVTIKRDIALPAVLGRICPAPCEKVCRRGDLDSAVSICLMKRLAADVDLASSDPYSPECNSSTGKRVVIVGAGPTGLSAAYYLCQLGHACTIYDENPSPGGRVLRETTTGNLSHEVLEAEIAAIIGLGIELETGKRVGRDAEFAGLRSRCDAVLIACGATARDQGEGWGVRFGQRGIEVTPRTFETCISGVFAAGNAVRGSAMVVRNVSDGKEAATAIDQFLHGQPVTGEPEPFNTKIGRMTGDELARFAGVSVETVPCGNTARPTSAVADGSGVEEASRCLHCDCRGQDSCKLRKYAAIYGAHPRRFKADRRVYEQSAQHAEVIYEPGKCIDCGLCIQIAAAAGEPVGLTFVGRGFDVRVAVPLARSLAEALTKVAAECVAACPTAALTWKRATTCQTAHEPVSLRRERKQTDAN